MPGTVSWSKTHAGEVPGPSVGPALIILMDDHFVKLGSSSAENIWL